MSLGINALLNSLIWIWDTSDPCIGITINQIIPMVDYDEVLNELSTLGKQVLALFNC